MYCFSRCGNGVLFGLWKRTASWIGGWDFDPAWGSVSRGSPFHFGRVWKGKIEFKLNWKCEGWGEWYENRRPYGTGERKGSDLESSRQVKPDFL